MSGLRGRFSFLWRRIKSLVLNQLISFFVKDAEDLIDWHFRFWSDSNHVSKGGLDIALNYFKSKPIHILETGTSAWGTDSTRLFDSYVKNFGGTFLSIDIRSFPSERLKDQLSCNSTLIIGDSVSEIEKLPVDKLFDLVYLDSFDADWDDPEPSALHGLNEMKVVLSRLKQDAVVVIDDTPKSFEFETESQARARDSFRSKYGAEPGKGGLVLKFLRDHGVRNQVLHHSSNLVINIQNT